MGLFKKIFIAVFILLIISTFGLGKLYWDSKQKAERIEASYKSLEDDNKTLTLRYSELNIRQKNQIDSLSDSLKVKPKFITRYVRIVTNDTIYITDTVYIHGEYVAEGIYSFSKDTSCFSMDWVVDINNIIPKSAITQLSYNNEIEYLLYLERRQRQWWFIKYRSWFKKDAKLKSVSKCGKSKVEDIEIIKR